MNPERGTSKDWTVIPKTADDRPAAELAEKVLNAIPREEFIAEYRKRISEMMPWPKARS